MTSAQSQVDNGVNVQALLGAREALTATPEGAKFKWRASHKWVRGTHSQSTVSSFYGLGAEQKHHGGPHSQPQVAPVGRPDIGPQTHHGLEQARGAVGKDFAFERAGGSRVDIAHASRSCVRGPAWTGRASGGRRLIPHIKHFCGRASRPRYL